MDSLARSFFGCQNIDTTYVGAYDVRPHVLLIEWGPIVGPGLADAGETAGRAVVVHANPTDAPACAATLDGIPVLNRPVRAEDAFDAVRSLLSTGSRR